MLKIKNMIKFLNNIFKRKKKKIDPFYEQLSADWGKDDVYGPWTKSVTNDDGTLKFFKSYWLLDDFSKDVNIDELK
jgi:hypothetical protein